MNTDRYGPWPLPDCWGPDKELMTASEAAARAECLARLDGCGLPNRAFDGCTDWYAVLERLNKKHIQNADT